MEKRFNKMERLFDEPKTEKEKENTGSVDKPKQISGNIRRVGDYLRETKEKFYQKMGWSKLDF